MHPSTKKVIERHIERLEKGWVPRFPSRPGEACAVMWKGEDGRTRSLTARAWQAVDGACHQLYGVGIVPFNDRLGPHARKVSSTKARIIDLFKKAMGN